MARTYAVLGSTGNCGSALIEILLKRGDAKLHAYCRNRSKLLKQLPNGVEVDIFEGSIQDVDLLKSCVRGCQVVFLVATTNVNIPGCSIAQDCASALIKALESLNKTKEPLPKLVLLSSASLDENLSRNAPWLLRQVLYRTASNVYNDIAEAEKLLRAEKSWLTSIYIKPGALSVDIQRGHALSFTDEDSPLSYLDLAAAMIEAADDPDGTYDSRNVSVVNTNGKASFPWNTPMTMLRGLITHFFPWLHPYLPF